MSNRTGIVFDMDDTLYKEERYRESGLRTVARHFAASCMMLPEELYEIMQEDPRNTFERVTELAAQNNVSVTVADQLAVYRSHRPDISLSPKVCHVLEELRRRGYMLGVITDGRAWGQLNKIAALGLNEYIDSDKTIVTSLYDTDKHHEKPFDMICERMGEAEEMVYVGDNPEKDFLWPNRKGWQTVMLRDVDSCNIHKQDPEKWPIVNRAKTTIDNIETLLNIFK